MMKKALGMLFALLVTCNGNAMTGKELLAFYGTDGFHEDRGAMVRTLVTSYVMAIYSCTNEDYKKDKYRTGTHCVSVVRIYLQNNPTRLGNDADVLCREAFGDAFGFSDVFYAAVGYNTVMTSKNNAGIKKAMIKVGKDVCMSAKKRGLSEVEAKAISRKMVNDPSFKVPSPPKK